MQKKVDFKRFRMQVLVFLIIMVLGLLTHVKAQQTVYSEDFSSSSDGAITSPKWEVETGKATPEVFWVQNQKFDCKNVRGEATWSSSLIDISSFASVKASVSLMQAGAVNGGDYIRVYYNVDGKGEVLFSTNGNKQGAFGAAQAYQANISGKDLQIIIHVRNNGLTEKYSFDNVIVEGEPQAFVWKGTVDSLWNEPRNWSVGKVPSENDDVIINAGTVFRPVITDVAECNNVTIAKNASLKLSTAAVLRLDGNLQCDGFFSTGNSGTVKLVGDNPQTLESAMPLSFYNLDINNRSTQGVTTTAKVMVLNRLSMWDACLTAADSVIVMSDATDAIAVYSDSSYIVGKLKRKIKHSGEQSYVFPVGFGAKNTFHSATVEAYSLEGTNFITVSFVPQERCNPASLNAKGDDFTYEFIATEGMWVIVPDVEPKGGWYDLSLSVKNISGLTDNLFGILKRPVGAGPEAWTAAFGNSSPFGGDGRKLSDGFTLKKYCNTFSEFIVGGGGVAIPIELLDFKADLVNGKVDLNWTTATETDNAYFTVEKSNGTDFKEVVKVDASGNSSIQKTYSTVDEKPFTGTSYYRLRQTDYSGKSTTSDIISVKNESNASQMVFFPNPTQGIFKVKFLSSVSKADVTIYNQQGTVSFSKTFLNLSGSQLIELNLKNELVPGIYYMQISSGAEDFSIEKIVME